MHIHEVTYSTNNNIYLIASCAKIVIVKGHDLICKPPWVTSLCLGYVIHKFSHTSWIAFFFSKTFWIAVDSEYISYNIETENGSHGKCRVYSSNNSKTWTRFSSSRLHCRQWDNTLKTSVYCIYITLVQFITTMTKIMTWHILNMDG